MTPERPLVSVVTANHNGARHLPEAISSVLGQTLRELELIIVDDGSSDESVAVIERKAAGDRRLRLFKQPANGGPAAARNRALCEARGRWIAVFDSDDLMAPDRLESLVARAAADGADIVVDNLLVFHDGEAGPGRPFLRGQEYAAPRWIALEEYIRAARMYARGPSLGYLKPLFRAEALAGSRYREALRIGEDYDLVVRLLANGRRLRLEPRALYRYRKHGQSVSQVLRREHILQMIAADQTLAADLAAQPAAVRRAQQRRLRSLQAALAYDGVTTALKSRDVAGALAAAFATPAAWPLLALPVQARLKRLAARMRSPERRSARPAAA